MLSEEEVKKEGVFRIAPIKTFERSHAKIQEYQEEFKESKTVLDRLKDILRCSIVLDSEARLLEVFHALTNLERNDLSVVEVKNGFKDLTKKVE